LPISAPDVIVPAFRHTKEQLLHPFRFAQWMRLAFVGLLAGEMGSGGGCNANLPLNTQHHGTQHILAAPWPGSWPAPFSEHPLLFAGLLAAAFVVLLALGVLFTYISSVMRFILFDSIIARECHIRANWARRTGAGFRLFIWRILFSLVTLAALLIFIGIPAACAWALGWFTHARDHVMGLVLGGICLFVLVFVLVVLLAVVNVMTKDFVVPQMALEDVSAMEGWRRLWSWLKFDKGGYAGYIGMKIVLAIGAGIAVAIVSFIAILALLIPIGGVGVFAVLAGKAAGWTWNLHTIALAVIAGCVALAILIFVLSLISVPVIVFFPAYSIYFFAPRYPPLAALLWPEPPTSIAPG
jgi:hypothetical protein